MLTAGTRLGDLSLEVDLNPEEPGRAFRARSMETGVVCGAFWVADAARTTRPVGEGILPVERAEPLAQGFLVVTPYPGDFRASELTLSEAVQAEVLRVARPAARALGLGESPPLDEVWLTLDDDSDAHDTMRVSSVDELEAVQVAGFHSASSVSSAPPPAAPAQPKRSKAGRRDAHVVSVQALVTDRAGVGHVVHLVVSLTPGGSGVRTTAQVHRDSEVAGQVAVAVALGAAASEHGVVWSVRGDKLELHGTSVGLALAVATRAALLGQAIPPGWAFTGGVDLDGRVVPVAGVPAKLRAARAAGIARVAIPVGVLTDGQASGEHTEVARVDPLFDQLFIRRWRPPWRWTALLIPVLLAFTEACSGADAWLHHPVLSLTQGVTEVEDVVLVEIPMSADLRARRADYPALFDTLADGGATAVFFDIALSVETDDDVALAASLRQVSDRMPVFLPVRMRDGMPQLPASTDLREAGRLGIIEARQDALFGHVRAIPVRRIDGDGSGWWHLAALTAHAHAGARGVPAIDGTELRLGPLVNPVSLEELWLPPIGEPARVPVASVAEAAAAGRLRDKAVVVGVVGGSEDLHRTPAGVRTGAAIEAGVVQVLLRQAGLRHLSAEAGSLCALLLGLATGLLRRTVPKPRAIGLLVPMLAAIAAVLLLGAGWLVPILSSLLAAGIGWWAGRPGERA